MSHLLPVLGSSTEQMLTSDTANSANAIVERDSSGNIAAGAGTFAGLLTGGLGLVLKSTAKTANFTASRTESTMYSISSAGGAVTVALPAVASSAGTIFVFFIETAGNNVVLDGNASETINGATTKTCATQYAWAIIFPNGGATAWLALFGGTWT